MTTSWFVSLHVGSKLTLGSRPVLQARKDASKDIFSIEQGFDSLSGMVLSFIELIDRANLSPNPRTHPRYDVPAKHLLVIPKE